MVPPNTRGDLVTQSVNVSGGLSDNARVMTERNQFPACLHACLLPSCKGYTIFGVLGISALSQSWFVPYYQRLHRRQCTLKLQTTCCKGVVAVEGGGGNSVVLGGSFSATHADKGRIST